MSNIIKRISLTLLLMLFLLFVIIPTLIYFSPREKSRVYDCGMAEWHPDIPKEVKEECRKRYKNLTTT